MLVGTHANEKPKYSIGLYEHAKTRYFPLLNKNIKVEFDNKL